MNLVSPPESITHLHLLSVLVTEISRRYPEDGRVRILDAGCGNGHLTTFLQINLAALFPALQFEIHGYDVADHGVQAGNYFSGTLAWCEQHCPHVRWEERLKLISHEQSWPFEAGYFDYVVSNQVLEHVWDHPKFFAEHYRVLKAGGRGAHLFPLKHYIHEGHLLMPFVHRISDWFFLKTYISFMSRLGIGKFRGQKQTCIDDYAERHADYMTFYTNYLSYAELMAIVKQSRLRPSLRYTVDFYLHKLRQLLRREMIVDLGQRKHSGLAYLFGNHCLKYVSSITLFVEKRNAYNHA